MSPGDDYLWIGPASGDWNDASNWEDLTTNVDPATLAPGLHDSVTFNSSQNLSQVIGGTGDAASLTFNGSNIVTGDLSVAGPVVVTSGLGINAGATISAATVDMDSLNAAITVEGNGAALLVGGTLGIENPAAVNPRLVTQDFGELSVSDGARVQAAGLVLGVDSYLDVDSGSSVEVGTLGNAAVGALTVDYGATLGAVPVARSNINGNVIDNGDILDSAAAGEPEGNELEFSDGILTGDGTIETQPNCLTQIEESVSGSLTLKVDAGASLDLGTVGSRDTIAFAGAGAVLNVFGQEVYNSELGEEITSFSMDGLITGFNASNAITVDAPVTTATYQTGSGMLALVDGASLVTMLNLAGDYGDQGFLAVPVSSNQTEIVLAPAPASGTSPGTSTDDNYLWVGPVSGDWNDASNWEDLTTSADPAALAPGLHDSVTFNSSQSLSQVTGGTGDAASLTFNGSNVVTGNLSVAGPVVVTSGLGINAGATISAATVDMDSLNAAITVEGNGAALLVGGTLGIENPAAVNPRLVTQDFGEFSVSDGARVQAAGLVIGVDSGLSVDTTSTVEIGTLGNAAVGALTVDPGATLDAESGYGTNIDGNVIDNGDIVGSVTYYGLEFEDGSLTGDGTVETQEGFLTSIQESVSGSLTLQMDAGASLDLGAVGSRDTIAFAGADAVLNMSGQEFYSSELGEEITSFSMDGVITGFNASDAIVVGAPVTTATYQTGSGMLAVLDGASLVTMLNLAGNYGDEGFLAVPISSNQTEIVLAPPPASGTSPGTTTDDNYIWIGGASGNWNDAANWEDLTTNAAPATIAPGATDSVTIASAAPVVQVIGGSGDAASLTFGAPNSFGGAEGSNIVTGRLVVGSLAVGSLGDAAALEINPGATISATTVNINADNAAISVDGNGAALLVSGTLGVENPAVASELYQQAYGELSAADGARVEAGTLVLGVDTTLYVDETSSVEIGTLGTAAVGALTVDHGATVDAASGNRTIIDGNVIDNGDIVGSATEEGLEFEDGSLTGDGTIETQADFLTQIEESIAGSLTLKMDAGASLDLGAVGSRDTIAFAGAGAVLNVYGQEFYNSELDEAFTSFSMDGVITGFNASNAIILESENSSSAAIITAASYNAGSGILTLLDGTSLVSSLHLTGDYGAQSFLAVSISSTETEIVLSSTVASGETLNIPSGGSVSNSVIYTGGYENVAAGGIDITPTLAGGKLELASGATVTGTIAFTTTGSTLIIDPAPGGATTIPANTLTGFAPGDTIELSGVTYAPSQDSYTIATAGTLSINADGTDYNLFIAGVKAGQHNFSLSGDLTITEVACYATGTRIRTAHGEVPVENLAIGDVLLTLHAGPQKIKWLGHCSYNGRFVAGNKNILPICIKREAIAENIPTRDLFVSPGHAICIDGTLIHAFRLVNGVSITQAVSVESLSYYHIETESHEVIFAENCPAETFIDENFRARFQNAAEYRALYPVQNAGTITCLPLLEDGFALHDIQQRLNARARILPPPETHGALRGYVDEPGPTICSGWAQDLENPETPVCLDIMLDGTRAARVLANLYRADLRQAGLGTGCHAFRATLPTGIIGRLEVRRAADGAELPWTEAALAHAA